MADLSHGAQFTRGDSLSEPSETRGIPSRFRTFCQFDAFCSDRKLVSDGLTKYKSSSDK